MASPTYVDSNTGFAGAADTNLDATIDWTPTAGNLLVFVVGGDKNIGTFTMSGWTIAVDLRSTSVSLVIAYKESDGTEGTVAGTCTTNAAGSQTWIAEYAQAGSGPWQQMGTKGEHNSDESNVTVWDTGTTGTCSGDAVAIAAWACDSVNTAGTPSYTNGFTQVRTTGNGAGQAGSWVAHLLTATSGNTYTETLTRTGGTADQHSGAIVLLGRGAAATTLSPSAIASTEAFGTAVVSQAVVGTGIASDEAIGSHTVARAASVDPSGIATAEAVGSHTVINPPLLLPSAIAGVEAFGTHVLTSGITIAPSGITTAESFGPALVHPSPFLVQADNHFIPGGTLTFDAPLPDSTANAGNAIVLVIVGDKNLGTLTLTGLGWNVPVNLRSTSLSLVMAWKEAAGGETGASGSFTSGNPGGSQIYIAEIESDDPGVWALKASASANTNETNVTSQSTGTTGTTVGDGIALSAIGVDSFKSDTTDTYTNGFTSLFAQSSGDAETGMWIGQHGAVAGATYETTLTRVQLVDPLVPDQMSGAMIVLGKAFVQDVAPVGVESALAFGTAIVPGPLQPSGILTAEAFGSLTVDVGDLLITPVAIESAEAFGIGVLSSGFVIQQVGVASGEAFGTIVVEVGARRFWLGSLHVEAVKVGDSNVTAGYVGPTLVF